MMPKGKAGISGFMITRNYPKISENQKCALLDGLSRAREKAGRESLIGDLREQVWNTIYRRSAIYRGHLSSGLPINEGERTKEINAIKKQAGVVASKLDALPEGRRDRLLGHLDKLIEQIRSSDVHSKDMIHKAMSREVNDLMETGLFDVLARLKQTRRGIKLRRTLRKFEEQFDGLRDLADQLARLSVIDTSVVRYRRSEPNPYLAYFVRDLICAWEEAVGDLPGRTWDDYADNAGGPGEQRFPFLEWANSVLSGMGATEGGTISARLARQELHLEKHQRKSGLDPTRILS